MFFACRKRRLNDCMNARPDPKDSKDSKTPKTSSGFSALPSFLPSRKEWARSSVDRPRGSHGGHLAGSLSNGSDGNSLLSCRERGQILHSRLWRLFDGCKHRLTVIWAESAQFSSSSYARIQDLTPMPGLNFFHRCLLPDNARRATESSDLAHLRPSLRGFSF